MHHKQTAAETFGTLSMLNDFGWNMHREVWGDASVALGIISGNGLGKTRHLDTGSLWIQQVAAEERFKSAKVLGSNKCCRLIRNI